MSQKLSLPDDRKNIVLAKVEQLSKALDRNLKTLLAYGSSVRGDFQPGLSDINLLILLEVSTPEAHRVIGECFRGRTEFDLFVLGQEGLERSMQMFAIKFRSIKRNYRILHGQDFLSSWQPEERVFRFLCEQSLRNRRLRTKRAYIVSMHDPVRFTRHVTSSVPGLFSDLTEALICAGIEMPQKREDRLPIIQKALGPEAEVLTGLLALRKKPVPLEAEAVHEMHAAIYRLMSRALQWMNQQWPSPTSP